jgi:hypothetical protein
VTSSPTNSVRLYGLAGLGYITPSGKIWAALPRLAVSGSSAIR